MVVTGGLMVRDRMERSRFLLRARPNGQEWGFFIARLGLPMLKVDTQLPMRLGMYSSSWSVQIWVLTQATTLLMVGSGGLVIMLQEVVHGGKVVRNGRLIRCIQPLSSPVATTTNT